ncbi:hypothetical protein MAHJHV61_24330 [Mycobacterium avium subsp. hominissuis]
MPTVLFRIFAAKPRSPGTNRRKQFTHGLVACATVVASLAHARTTGREANWFSRIPRIRHFPGRQARKVSCPILFAICENDTVAPAKATQKYAAQAPRGEIKLYDAGHFDIYVGADFERNVTDQLNFLSRHVPVS